MNGITMTPSFPIGVSDFRKIISEDYLYVDKTLMIKQILDDKAEVYLYTRPRRFGKTLNLSMVDYFFNNKYADGPELFKGLKISEYPDHYAQRNQYPVIRLDMSKLNCIGYECLIASLKNLISELMSDFQYLLQTDPSGWNREIIDRLSQGTYKDINQLETSLSNLSKVLHEYHGKPPIVIIDEYDSCVQKAFNEGEYDRSIHFLKRFFMMTFKANTDLKFGIISGILRTAREGLFSGLNNLDVCDIFTDRFDEFYGFTEDEVTDLTKKCGMEDIVDDIKKWYDGYRFGKTDVYNPWSVLNCLKNNGKFGTYWMNSGSTDLIEKIIMDRPDEDIIDTLLEISSKPEASVTMAVNPSVTYRDLASNAGSAERETNLFSMLVMSGYLKAIPEGDYFNLSIPNLEVKQVFDAMIARILGIVLSKPSRIYDYLVSKDAKSAEEELNRLFAPGSIRDKWGHNDYKHALMILFQYMGYKNVTEMESGNGFIDIYVEPTGVKPPIVIEIKTARTQKEMKPLSEKALGQIVENDYKERVQPNAILCGIAFSKKKCAISFL